MAGWAKALHTRTVCPGELQVHEHVTLIPPDAAAPRSRGLGSTLPPDLLDQVRARVRVLGLLMMISFAIDPVLFFSGAIAMRLNEGAFPTDFFRDAVFYYGDIGVVAASVVLWRMAKSSRVPVAGFTLLASCMKSPSALSCLSAHTGSTTATPGCCPT
jgi:hypothetical protein